MSQKTAVSLGMIIGSTIGGFIPSLWGDSIISYWSIATSAVGAIIGIIIAYRMSE